MERTANICFWATFAFIAMALTGAIKMAVATDIDTQKLHFWLAGGASMVASACCITCTTLYYKLIRRIHDGR